MGVRFPSTTGDTVAELLRSTVACFRAGHPHAERYLTELGEHSAAHNDPEVRQAIRAMRVMLHIRAGRFAEVRTAATHSMQLDLVDWYQGGPTGLNSWVDAAAQDDWPAIGYVLAEDALSRQDAEAARQIYLRLESSAREPAMAGEAVVCLGSVEQALGVAALTLGDNDLAITHLRNAVQDNLALGHLPAATLARSRLADALQRRSAGDDLAAAARHRDLACRDAQDLGMVLVGNDQPSTASEQRLALMRAGDQWTLSLGSRTAVVYGGIGMDYLSILVANQGYEITAMELSLQLRLREQLPLERFRRQLDQLQADLDEHVTNHDLVWADRARDEKARALAQLTAAGGLDAGGLWHPSADAERARVAVGRAIRRAVDQIKQADPVMARHLGASVHIGLHCCYRPY
jgi:hypothetical protein